MAHRRKHASRKSTQAKARTKVERTVVEIQEREVLDRKGNSTLRKVTVTVEQHDEMYCEHETHAWKTFDFEQVAASARYRYLADPLMRTGYSIQKRRRDVVLSLFAWHNETINVWSHLLGGILFVVLFFSWYYGAEPSVRLGQFAHDSMESLSTQFRHASLEAKKYSDALSGEANEFRNSMQSLAEKVALQISNMPFELRAEVLRQQSALLERVHDERQMIETAFERLEKRGSDWIRRTAIVEWMLAHAKNEPVDMDAFANGLKLKLASFVPKDFEARRTAAAIRGWLAEESRSLETLLLRFDPRSTSTPVWPVLIFCLGGVLCLGCSALYHWWVGYCRHYHDALCRVDLAGISFMIWGSCVPPIYYVFYEDPFWRNLYLAGSTLFCGATLVFTMLPSDMLHKAKVARVYAYLIAGAFAIAPLMHCVIQHGPYSVEVRRYVNDGYLGLVGFLYVLGAFIYISRFPEKFYPRKFDYVFASHQIWHALVFLAAYVHYFGAVELYLWRVEEELHSGQILMNASASLG